MEYTTKNDFIGPGCKASGVYNLQGILTGNHQHKERKASLKTVKGSLENKVVNNLT